MVKRKKAKKGATGTAARRRVREEVQEEDPTEPTLQDLPIQSNERKRARSNAEQPVRMDIDAGTGITPDSTAEQSERQDVAQSMPTAVTHTD